MRFSWPLGKRKRWRGTKSIASQVMPGVRFEIVRMTFSRRGHLLAAIRDLTNEMEYRAGGSELAEKVSAALIRLKIDRTYLEWGLRRIENLEVDGAAATPLSLAENGPEDLCREVLDAIRHECGLSEQERKN